MKTTKLFQVMLASVLCLSQSGAWAQPGRGNDKECGRGNCDHDQFYKRGHQDNRRQDGGDRRQNEERGAGPDHAYHRGGHMPSEYRRHQYVVDDWRGHGLPPPPRGHHWVQTGGDYVLVAIGSGLIVELYLGR